jgi:hypothetical protein
VGWFADKTSRPQAVRRCGVGVLQEPHYAVAYLGLREPVGF